MDIESVENLYHLYGFETKQKTANFIVFLYSTGYFRNIEIVYDGSDIDEIIKEYQALRFPVNSIKFITLDLLHENLFNGFFLLKENSEKLKKKYSLFVNERNFIDDHYSYIPCSYYKNNKEGKDNIVDFLCDQINDKFPSLTIVEAAAGYGKTCTISEIMNKIGNSEINKIVPLFIELSKNRNARIFKYVLLDEIDRNFSTLSSELVISEIKKGNVPLIIDGFDELLSSLQENNDIDNETVDKTQTMLETITELFDGESKAKIIITSRKTSLISNKVLDDLMLKIENCPITRITLCEPTIADWLSREKISFFESNKIPLQQFSNPILLKFLQKSDISEFTIETFSVKKIIDENIAFLLKRESTRQQLNIYETEQNELFQKFAAYFIDFQISSEEPSFIFEIFKEILKQKMPEYLNRYTDLKTKPSEEEFIGKLSRHVLLDTNKAYENQIGFVNDFIFGFYLAKVVRNNAFLKDTNFISQDHVDKICTTYKVMEKSDKKDLFEKLKPYISNYSGETLIQIDSQINGYLTKQYDNIQLDGIFFENFDFSFNNSINQSIFANCIFSSCIIGDNITNCQFIDCSFYKLKFTDENLKNKFLYGLENNFYKCNGIIIDHEKGFIEEHIINEENYEKEILEIFWKPSRPAYDKYKHTKTIFQTFPQKKSKKVAEAIESLKKKGLLLQPGYCLEINKERISDIIQALGREHGNR